MVIAIRNVSTRQAARVNGTAGAIVTRVTEAVSIMAHSMGRAVVGTVAAFGAIGTRPFQVAQAGPGITNAVTTTILWAPWAEQFHFQTTTFAAVNTEVIEVTYAFSIDAVSVVVAVVRARDCLVATCARPAFTALALAQ